MKKVLLIAVTLVIMIGTVVWLHRPKLKELVYCSTNSPDTLISFLNHNEEAKYLCELIFDGLVNKTIVERGRERYEWALIEENGIVEEKPEDRRFIIIYLRKGVFWHDGREFTSDDVIYTFKAINESNSPLKSWLNTFIRSYEKVDNYKIRLKLTKEMSRPELKELFSPLKILPRWYTYKSQKRELPYNLKYESEISKEFKWKPVGTGPYKIKKRTSEEIILEANKEYYLVRPEIERIKMQVVGDIAKAVKLLKGNQYALLFDVKPEFFGELRNLPLKYQVYLPYSFYAIVYNLRRDPFRDPFFRKAVSCGIDKRRLAQRFLGDSTNNIEECINHSIFPTNSMYVQDCPPCFQERYGFDPDRAKEFLRQSSVTKTFHLLISSSIEGERVRRLASDLTQMMRDLRIKVVVDDLNRAQYYTKIRNADFDAVFMEFSGFDHLYDIRPLFWEKNVWGVNDDELNNLLKEFGRTLSWESFRIDGNIIVGLKDLAGQIHEKVEEITPACFLFTVPRRAYYSDRLMNVTIHPEVGFSTIERWKLKQE